MENKKDNKKLLGILIPVVIVAIIGIIACFFLGGDDGYRMIQVYEVNGEAIIERPTVGNMDAYENLNLISGDKVTTKLKSYTRLKLDEDKYLLAEEELPEEESYDGYLQLENGVGMLRLFTDEFEDGIQQLMEEQQGEKIFHNEEISIITGKLSFPCIKTAAERMEESVEGLTIHVHAIRNDFFGENITVSGLLTGTDIIAQGKELPLGTRMLLPENVLRSGEDVLLDDYTVQDLEKTLQVSVDIVKSSGYDFIKKILNILVGEIAYSIKTLIGILVVVLIHTILKTLTDGLKENNMKIAKMLLIALTFAIFQGVMPLIGYFVGHSFIKYIEKFVPWIALILLLFLGVKMIIEEVTDNISIINIGRSGWNELSGIVTVCTIHNTLCGNRSHFLIIVSIT